MERSYETMVQKKLSDKQKMADIPICFCLVVSAILCV